MIRPLKRTFAAAVLATTVLLPQGLAAEPSSGQPPPKELRMIDHEHPLFIIPFWRGTGAFRQYKETYPEALKPLTTFCTWNLTLDSADFRQALDDAGVRLFVGFGWKSLAKAPQYIESARRYPQARGIFAIERASKFAENEFAAYLDRLADVNGCVGWSCLATFNRYFDTPKHYRLVRDHKDRIILVSKCNGCWYERDVPDGPERTRPGEGRSKFGTYVYDQEVLLGAYLTGAIDSWGYHPEEWIWYENGYTRLWEYSLPHSRGRIEPWNEAYHNIHSKAFPGNLEGTGILNGAINGATVLAIEVGLFSGGEFSERFAEVHIPLWQAIVAKRLIPSCDDVLRRTRAVSTGVFKRLYARTATYIQHDGRYGVIPSIPKAMPKEDWGRLREKEFLPGNYSYRYLPFLNALYPAEGAGRSFVARRGPHWIVWNPYEAENKETDFEIPLGVNTCRTLAGRLGPYAFAIVTEYPDRVEVYLSNYWMDHPELWDRRVEYAQAGRAGQWDKHRRWHAEFEANRRKMRSEGRAAMLKRTRLSLEGHTGPAAPALEITGHDGFRHEARWDAAHERCELDVDHNGVVQLTVRASGSDTGRKPPEALSRNLAVGRPTATSSLAGVSPGTHATDGLPHTSWQAAAGKEAWLRVDLGEATAVSAYKVMGAAPKDRPLRLSLQAAAAEDGPWEAIHQAEVRGEFFEVFPVDLPAARRWVRLRAAAWPEGAAIAEFGLYSGPNDELKTWEPLARPKKLAGILALLAVARSDTEFAAVEEAALDFCEAAEDHAGCIAETIAALPGAGEYAAASLVRVLGRLGGAEALAAVRRAAMDGRREVREAAEWALATWPDAAAMNDMIAIARRDRDLSLRANALKSLLAIHGVEGPKPEGLGRALAEGLKIATETEDKVRLLEAVRAYPGREALEALAAKLADGDSPQLAGPAATACLDMAGRIGRDQPEAVRRALAQVAERGGDAALVRRANQMLENLAP